MKNYKNKIIIGVVIAVILAFVFWYGGDAPSLRGWTVEPTDGVGIIENDASENQPLSTAYEDNTVTSSADTTPEPTATPSPTEPVKQEKTEAEQKAEEIPTEQTPKEAIGENKPKNADNTPMTPTQKEALAEQIAKEKGVTPTESGDTKYSEENSMVINKDTGKDKYLTDPVPEGKPVPIEPQDAVISDKELTCTLSVRCDTILKNISWLDEEKVDIVPEDGVIFAEKTVTFYEGESVFNLLRREMKRNKIHMEFEDTPIYNSAYIEGIANLYEFDCGELSGWMYKVNGWFPNYGSSRYQLKAGDKVEWVYTCDLGIDVGGYYAANGRENIKKD